MTIKKMIWLTKKDLEEDCTRFEGILRDVLAEPYISRSLKLIPVEELTQTLHRVQVNLAHLFPESDPLLMTLFSRMGLCLIVYSKIVEHLVQEILEEDQTEPAPEEPECLN